MQSTIRIALSDHGVVFRTNSGEFWQGEIRYSKEFKQTVLINLRKVQGLPKGFSDLIFFSFSGETAFIEVKKPGEKPKPDQVKFLSLMKKYKFKTGVARNVDDALKIINPDNLCPHGFKDWDDCPVCCH